MKSILGKSLFLVALLICSLALGSSLGSGSSSVQLDGATNLTVDLSVNSSTGKIVGEWSVEFGGPSGGQSGYGGHVPGLPSPSTKIHTVPGFTFTIPYDGKQVRVKVTPSSGYSSWKDAIANGSYSIQIA